MRRGGERRPPREEERRGWQRSRTAADGQRGAEQLERNLGRCGWNKQTCPDLAGACDRREGGGERAPEGRGEKPHAGCPASGALPPLFAAGPSASAWAGHRFEDVMGVWWHMGWMGSETGLAARPARGTLPSWAKAALPLAGWPFSKPSLPTGGPGLTPRSAAWGLRGHQVCFQQTQNLWTSKPQPLGMACSVRDTTGAQHTGQEGRYPLATTLTHQLRPLDRTLQVRAGAGGSL